MSKLFSTGMYSRKTLRKGYSKAISMMFCSLWVHTLISRGRHMLLSQVCLCFCLTFSQRKYILITCKKRWKAIWIIGLQQSGISHKKALKIVNFKYYCGLNKRTPKGFVAGHYQNANSTLNDSCIDNYIYCTPKKFFRIVFVSQSIVLQFLKEVQT